MDLITTTSELALVCTRLKRHPFVTIDTEFLRETTYYPILCVAQLASPDEAVVVDAMASGIDLKPFFELMADEKVLKVFHAARQDIEIVWHRAGMVPHPIFDTRSPPWCSATAIRFLRPARAAHHRRRTR
jgi:ribonuclease D